MTENTKIIGRVIKVSKEGWGFISAKDIEYTRIFFHWTALKQDTLNFKELHPGIWVEFTPVQLEGRGYRAIHVRVIDKPKRNEHDKSEDVSSLHELESAADGQGNN